MLTDRLLSLYNVSGLWQYVFVLLVLVVIRELGNLSRGLVKRVMNDDIVRIENALTSINSALLKSLLIVFPALVTILAFMS